MTEKSQGNELLPRDLMEKAKLFDPKNPKIDHEFEVDHFRPSLWGTKKMSRELFGDTPDRSKEETEELTSKIDFLRNNRDVVSNDYVDQIDLEIKAEVIALLGEIEIQKNKYQKEKLEEEKAEQKKREMEKFENHLDKSFGGTSEIGVPVSNTEQEKEGTIKLWENKLVRRVTSTAAAAAVMVTGWFGFGPHQARAEENKENLNVGLTIETTGTMPSQELSSSGGSAPEVTPSDPEVTPKIDVISDVSWIPLTLEEMQFLRESIENVSPTATPVPTEMIDRALNDREYELYGKYYDELRQLGCTDPNNLEAGVRWLYSCDNYTLTNNDGDYKYAIKFTDYVKREDIIRYCLTNKGLNVYVCENGKKILKVNFDKKMDKGLEVAIKWFKENGAENIEDFLASNGLYSIFPFIYNPEAGNGAALIYSDEGMIGPNFDKGSIKKFKDVVIRNLFINCLITESVGISYLSTRDSIKYNSTYGGNEIVKSLLVGYNFLYLYEKTGNEIYKVFGDNVLAMARGFARDFDNTSLTSPILLKEIKYLTESNLITPLGSNNWNFLKMNELASK